MSKKHLLIYFFLLALVIAVATGLVVFFFPAVKSNQTTDKQTNNMTALKINRLAGGECLERWLIGRSESIFNVLGRRYAEGEIIKAREINPEKHTPLYPQAAANWKIDTPAFFWMDKTTKALLVDGQYFSDLTVASAVDLPRGKEPLLIGRFFADDLPLTRRQLAELLLRTEVIQTYEHLEAELCLKEEREQGGVYTAIFHVHHTYCTNECSTGEYDFSVEINWNKGEIFLQNAPDA